MAQMAQEAISTEASMFITNFQAARTKHGPHCPTFIVYSFSFVDMMFSDYQLLLTRR